MRRLILASVLLCALSPPARAIGWDAVELRLDGSGVLSWWDQPDGRSATSGWGGALGVGWRAQPRLSVVLDVERAGLPVEDHRESPPGVFLPPVNDLGFTTALLGIELHGGRPSEEESSPYLWLGAGLVRIVQDDYHSPVTGVLLSTGRHETDGAFGGGVGLRLPTAIERLSLHVGLHATGFATHGGPSGALTARVGLHWF